MSNILRIYGLSQDPGTKNHIMVLQYAEGGDFYNWINKNYENYENYSWYKKVGTLRNIIEGLEEIHQKQMVHRDLHIGNLLSNNSSMEWVNNRIFISDMGLCGEVSNLDKTNIYGVMPYVAPEQLEDNLLPIVHMITI
ncbi:kinase-like domain-containing protein [Glomus cerebriforme]|uniref:Kinase-like domain-containing protein n=1 Tax=Glomus cerebriforme TaxID=658196 RepID=A0A397SCV7_9GLOM|nr:kinase-like domain-containing protein [Glomus cerebriforme]